MTISRHHDKNNKRCKLFIYKKGSSVIKPLHEYKAILWDCDGVLIDSEVLACASAAQEIASYGYHVTTEDFIERFMGKGLPQILREIDKETSLDLTSSFDRDKLRARQRQVFDTHLKAMPGIEEALRKISVPMAVASGSELSRLQHTLQMTGLRDFFNGHIYSADMVARGKPDPDIFLYAADKVGVAPQDCLVIEDGIHGIHAAHAAGMAVVAWLGGSHMTEDLRHKVLATQPSGILSSFTDLLAEA